MQKIKVSMEKFQNWDPEVNNDICRISIGKLIQNTGSQVSYKDPIFGETVVNEYYKKFGCGQKALHCQIICAQLLRLFSGVKKINELKGIKTDCLMFDR